MSFEVTFCSFAVKVINTSFEQVFNRAVLQCVLEHLVVFCWVRDTQGQKGVMVVPV